LTAAGAVGRQGGLDALKARDAGRAVGVGRVVGVVRLLSGSSLTSRALRRRILALALLVKERGDGDGGQDPDDQDHDQKLEEREALLAMQAITKAIEHGRVLLLKGGVVWL